MKRVRGPRLNAFQVLTATSVRVARARVAQVGDLLRDLKECVAEVKSNPGLKIEGTAAVYGAASVVPEALMDSILRSYCDIKMQVKPKQSSTAT